MRTRYPLAAGVLLTSLMLASCGADAAQPQTPPTSAAAEPAAPPPTTVGADPQEEPTPQPDAELTCDTIVSDGIVEALTSQGWTSVQEEFHIGETIVDDGLMCMWADFTTASDHGQMYAWGAIDDAKADAAMAGLTRDGWLRSTQDAHTYFTEDPAYAIATDADGFGMTYEFGDGWVKFADTKQGLLLIDVKR